MNWLPHLVQKGARPATTRGLERRWCVGVEHNPNLRCNKHADLTSFIQTHTHTQARCVQGPAQAGAATGAAVQGRQLQQQPPASRGKQASINSERRRGSGGTSRAEA